jgi:hypothetical protein
MPTVQHPQPDPDWIEELLNRSIADAQDGLASFRATYEHDAEIVAAVDQLRAVLDRLAAEPLAPAQFLLLHCERSSSAR